MARKRMRRLLSAIADVEVVAECTSGEQALSELDERDVDVAFLDIRMAGASGLEVSEAAVELGVEVVFTTAHPEHAVVAFEQGAADYLLKPVEAERLAAAVARVRERLSRAAAPRSESLDRVALEVRGELRLVDPGDVSHAVHDGQLVTVWVGAESILTELSLSELERKLPSGSFERVHRRALVNLRFVERLSPMASGGYRATLRGGHEVPVSRQAARALRRRLGIR
ncbi:MAG: response regulator transcription factor [Myxococcales bacterium]|nr:response regulator transcription factor [Myxococcales bacterium]MCB9576878.1 response regulator transcription factor [Polyangiaceae bacterium]